jgi:translation initiation factor 1
MSDEKCRLVYSTDKAIPRKASPAGKVPQTINAISRQKVYVRLERKGRGGKSVTLIEGIQMSVKDREELLRQLKTRLGSGGDLRDDVLEIQGDHRDVIITVLQGIGYRPKRSGG